MGDIKFRSDVSVELVTIPNGTDDMVINAARISTANDGNTEKMTHIEKYRFINFLMKNRHGSPFEHVAFTFRIEVPIFVVRELMRHRIASYNEESGRYTQLKPVFYVPNMERNLVQTGKPGAYVFEPGTKDQHKDVIDSIEYISSAAYSEYEEMLELGIAKEVARMVLPVNIFTSLYMTINARSLMNLLSLRVKDESSMFPSYPQREIEMMAEKMEKFFSQYMPSTHQSFIDNGRVAP